MKKKLVATLLTSVFILGGAGVPSFASGIDMEGTNEMYATKGVTGPSKTRYRTDINSALGNNKSIFYSVANNSFSKFTFGDTDENHKFYNVNGEADIELSEVTWTDFWHEEAVEVYLVNPVIETSKGNKPYQERDIELEGNSDNLYFAGVAFNKMVVQNGHIGNYIGDETTEGYEKERFQEILNTLGKSSENTERKFVKNDIKTEGDVEITGFNVPEEVVSAEGIILVDITGKVNSDFYKDNNKFGDDGFDLASIKVWSKEESSNEEEKIEGSATGEGERIGANGNWFMQNKIQYSNLQEGQTFNLVSGKKSIKVGEYTVKLNEEGKLIVSYNMNKNVNIKKEHLCISKTALKSSNPGKLDNADYNTSIDLSSYGIKEGEDFYIFAHFEIN